MIDFISKLKLIHKINLGFYLFMIVVMLLISVFYNVSSYMMAKLEENHRHELMIERTSDDISKSLKRLDFLAIQNSLHPVLEYDEKMEQTYQRILSDIKTLQNDIFFQEDKKIQQILDNIYSRVQGYKAIAKSLNEDMREDIEDGVYSILALTSTSNVISKEIENIAKAIEKKAYEESLVLQEHLSSIRIIVISVLLIFFLFMMMLNRKVVSSIANDLEQLKEMVISFFHFLSKKVECVQHFHMENDDEIAAIANIIDENMYIAEQIVQQQREEAKIIEERVKEATKEIIALNEEVEATQREVVFTMGAIAEERSKETGNHVKRVAEYSLILARLAGLSLEEAVLLKNASPMHDIGKIAIPDAVLHKPGKFTPEEFEVMKKHAEIGYGMLKHSKRSILKAAAIVAYEHHERWDGKGYPRGLKGEEIHIYGRITAIADVFDALGSDRVYKEAWPLEKIVKLFEEEKGKQFDPELVEIFLDNLEHFVAARENIDSFGSNANLAKFIEDFDKQAKILPS